MPDAAPSTRLSLALAILFFTAVAAFFAGLWLDIVALRLLAKPIPVLCLIVWLAASSRTPAGLPVMLGLGLSIVGDVVLETPGAPFVGGLLAFLVAHIAYIVGALIESRRAALLWLLPTAAFGVIVYSVLFPAMEDLALPVAVYVSVIAAMGWRMGARVDGRLLPWLGLIGAASFMLSDATIAVRKFSGDFAGARELIMLTYWGGQALIAASVLRALPRR